ncbi:MAG: mechanosensitive ion channel [Bacteroidales bacterium]|nr:mechanosensitive ion channel [Bacteroidales bacterium]
MKKKYILLALVLLLVAAPVYAVFNEKDFSQTLSVLRYELRQDYDRMSTARERMRGKNNSRRGAMVDLMKKCNELSLMLYSQNQDYTFDVTYALKEVTRQYKDFNANKMPFDEMVARLNLEIDRYERLVESLEKLPTGRDSLAGMPRFQMDSARTALYDSLGISKREARRPEGMPPMPPGADTLRRERPFVLDEQGIEDRDSCLFYARALLQMYTNIRNKVVIDSDHYEDASTRLEEIYNYAQERYKLIQKNIFVKGQDNYFKVLKNFKSYSTLAFSEVKAKYGSASNAKDKRTLLKSEWRGPVVVGYSTFVLFFIIVATLFSVLVIFLLKRWVPLFRDPEFKKRLPCIALLSGVVLFGVAIEIGSNILDNNFFVEASILIMVFAWLVAAILLSILIRLKPAEMNLTMYAYTPVIILGLLVISLRIIFIPNRFVNLVLPPVLVVFFIWQLFACRRLRGKIHRSDMIFSWITLFIIGVTAAVSMAGYVLLGLQAFIWWLFQLASIVSVMALFDLLKTYNKKVLEPRKKSFDDSILSASLNPTRGDYIRHTWFYDFLEMALLPIFAILSVPFSLHLASGVFDLTAVFTTALYHPIFDFVDKDGNAILHLSLYKIVLVSSMFFVFRYIDYLIRSAYRVERLEKVLRESGQDYVHANQVNLTLANNVISILVWGIYIIASIVILKIPMGAISIVAAGLATGIGLAMKDILNNFIYGIQLMSGRLRVGDYIECDGVRGKVESITYQSTQIETVEGAVMAFTNSTLFNQNFKNLTRNNSYELVKIVVGVSYGTDVEKARKVITEALSALHRQDRFGRELIDPKRALTVSVSDLAESSVDLAVKQYVLVEERFAYIAEAKEIIYDALNRNGIEIPFPQRDVHMK